MVYVEAAARMIAEVAEDDKIVVEKSTVPCRTAEDIRKTFAAIGKPGVRFEILSNPEFLAEGTAINDLLEPDRILIGSLNSESGLRAAAALAKVYARWVPPERIITMNLWSAEMAKLAANAFLAQRISSINSLSAVCEATGADIEEVSYACGLDNRIGSRMLKSSIGFGGSCFKKDLLSLVYIAESQHLSEVAAYWKSVIDINQYQKDRFIKRIVTCLFRTLTNKKVAILGYAYKKDTGDTRESAAISIVNNLLSENAQVSIYDPKAKEETIWQSIRESNASFECVKKRVKICCSAYEACEDADAVVIATEWDEFSNKPVDKRKPTFRKIALLHDTIAPQTDTGTLCFEEQDDKDGFPSLKEVSALIPETAEANDSPRSVTSSSTGTSSKLSRLDTISSSSWAQLSSRSSFADLANEGMSPIKSNESPSIAINSQSPSDTENHQQQSAYTCAVAQIPAQPHVLSPVAEETQTCARVDWTQIARLMRRPMWIFDGRNIVDTAKLERLGFYVESIGKPGIHSRSA